MLDTLSIDDFRDLVGTSLPLSQGERSGQVEVAAVRPLNNPSPRKLPPFVLTLRDVGAQRALDQGTYRLDHPQHGPLDLFIVPVGPDSHGMCYEAVFN